MASRNLLHKSKLPEFLEFVKTLGYQIEQTKGSYEVARFKEGSHPPHIIFERHDSPEHFTLQDKTIRLFRRWKAMRKG